MMKNTSGPIRTGLMAIAGISLWLAAGSCGAACLRKTGPSTALGPSYVFMLAPARALGTYLALGFTQIDCPSDLSVFRAYVAHLCAANAQGSAPLESELAIGVASAQACGDAKAGLIEAGG
jgi:hypothetical protein